MKSNKEIKNLSTEAELPKDSSKTIKEIFEKFESEYISLGYEKNRTSNDVFKMLDGIKSEILQKIKEGLIR